MTIESEPRCRHQVVDIPVVRFPLIEHQLFGGQCSVCGKHHSALTPSSVPAGQMGSNLIALGDPYRQIGEYVRRQPVVHADETRHFRNTECRWLWALVTHQACYFLTQLSRGKEAADTLLGDFPVIRLLTIMSGITSFPKISGNCVGLT